MCLHIIIVIKLNCTLMWPSCQRSVILGIDQQLIDLIDLIIIIKKNNVLCVISLLLCFPVYIRTQVKALPVSENLYFPVLQMGRGVHHENGSAAENHRPSRGKVVDRTADNQE